MTAPPFSTFGENRPAGSEDRTRSVVIVDDLCTWRLWLRTLLEQDPRLRVVGEAASAVEAREVIKATNPDVLTLDVEMPGMNGLRFLEHLMRLRPMPVVMFSAHTTQTSEESVRALSLGAVDCFHKTLDMPARNVDDLRARIFAAACSQPQRMRAGSGQVSYAAPASEACPPLILIGASTGGVLALERTLKPLPKDMPPIAVVQHMPATFLESFCNRLNGLLSHNVFLAEEGRHLKRGNIVLAPSDGAQTGVVRDGASWKTVRLPAQPDDVFTPSVDRLFEAAAPHGEQVVGCVLTGLGNDGARGARALADAGAQVLVQDEASCVVYGMPKSALENVPASQVTKLTDMGLEIVGAVHAIEARAGCKA